MSFFRDPQFRKKKVGLVSTGLIVIVFVVCFVAGVGVLIIFGAYHYFWEDLAGKV